MSKETVMTVFALVAAMVATAWLFGLDFLLAYLLDLLGGRGVPPGAFLLSLAVGAGLPVAVWLAWTRVRGRGDD